MFLNVFLFIVIIIIFLLEIKKIQKLNKSAQKLKNEIKKINVNNEILKDWLSLRQNGIILEDWFKHNDIKKIALYGYGILGKALYSELLKSDVEITCIIDKNFKKIHTNIPAVDIDSIVESDVIIVSVVNYFDEIEAELLNKYKCPIISIEDIIYGVGFYFNE